MQTHFRAGKGPTLAILILVTLISWPGALGQEIRFMPIRSAPLGSPAGTVGAPVTPEFNADLGCWELRVRPGVEVDFDLQAFGWGNAAGSPNLGAISAFVDPASYSTGVGSSLNPKGWPGSPLDGAYQANKRCEKGGDLSPCTPPFDPTCDNLDNGECVFASNWVMWEAGNVATISTGTLEYRWATAVLFKPYTADDGEIKTLGGLILEVDVNAAGTYLIDFDSDPLNTYMIGDGGKPIPIVALTPACITVIDADAVTKNRYVSFETGVLPVDLAFHVRMTASAHFPESIGDLGWVGAPDSKGTALVVPDPVFLSSWPAVVRAGDCEIVPAATYEIRATGDGVNFDPPVVVETTAPPIDKFWGDIIGEFNGAVWTPPNGVQNFADVQAAVKTFQAGESAAPLIWADVHPETPNRIANFNDVLMLILAFRGEPYPFSDPANCP